MADSAASGLFGSLGGSSLFSGGMFQLLFYIVAGLIVIAGLGALFYTLYAKKKKWFLQVEVKIPRSDNRLVNAEWALGTYDAKHGVVLIKRKKKRAVAMKPFDIKKYLQGSNILTVIQVGIEDFRPILTDSWLEVEDSETGETGALLKAKIDTSESKAWKSSFERESKAAFSIQSLLSQYASYIGFGILFFMIFIGFAVLYGRIKG